MRKKVMSTSKRKWIVSGLLGFGAVALLTTGFATWVVGVQKTKTDVEIDSTVEGTKNSMINITVDFANPTVDVKVVFSEKYTGSFVNTEGEADTDFKITPRIKIEIGKGQNKKADKISFKLGYKEGKETATDVDNNKVLIKDADTKTHFKSETAYEYFEIADASKEIIIPNASDGEWKITENANSYVYEFNQEITIFKWGSFFGHNTPGQYYDSLYENGLKAESLRKPELKTLFNTQEDVDFVVEEMNKMKDLFNSTTEAPKHIKLVCDLTTKAA